MYARDYDRYAYSSHLPLKYLKNLWLTDNTVPESPHDKSAAGFSSSDDLRVSIVVAVIFHGPGVQVLG